MHTLASPLVSSSRAHCHPPPQSSFLPARVSSPTYCVPQLYEAKDKENSEEKGTFACSEQACFTKETSNKDVKDNKSLGPKVYRTRSPHSSLSLYTQNHLKQHENYLKMSTPPDSLHARNK